MRGNQGFQQNAFEWEGILKTLQGGRTTQLAAAEKTGDVSDPDT